MCYYWVKALYMYIYRNHNFNLMIICFWHDSVVYCDSSIIGMVLELLLQLLVESSAVQATLFYLCNLAIKLIHWMRLCNCYPKALGYSFILKNLQLSYPTCQIDIGYMFTNWMRRNCFQILICKLMYERFWIQLAVMHVHEKLESMISWYTSTSEIKTRFCSDLWYIFCCI